MAGHLLLLNFGTYAETNRFKTLAVERKFLAADLMDVHPPGQLQTPGGVRQVRRAGVGEVCSFYGLNRQVWKSKLADDTPFQEAFRKWMESVVKPGVHCAYLNGHHWRAGDRHMFLSWGRGTNYFHARIDTEARTLEFGISDARISVDVKDVFDECRLVVGFGCNIATGINSATNQAFFGGSAIILGWERSTATPRADQESVNRRFFEYLDAFVQEQTEVPAEDRLEWFYRNHPMELIRAWGHATRNWLLERARARDSSGNFYKFEVNKEKNTVEPVKA
jgi:hypothetical protein